MDHMHNPATAACLRRAAAFSTTPCDALPTGRLPQGAAALSTIACDALPTGRMPQARCRACPRGTYFPYFLTFLAKERLRLKAPSTGSPASTAAFIASASVACCGRYSEVTLPSRPARPVLPTLRSSASAPSIHSLANHTFLVHDSSNTAIL